jgi:hypothetical protein
LYFYHNFLSVKNLKIIYIFFNLFFYKSKPFELPLSIDRGIHCMRRNQNIEKHPVETIQRLVNLKEKIMNF